MIKFNLFYLLNIKITTKQSSILESNIPEYIIFNTNLFLNMNFSTKSEKK